MPPKPHGAPASAARAILKRRDKPFKAPRTQPGAQNPHGENAFSAKPPPGYVYLQIGTPDLADRCRELSKERGVRMYLVHTTRTDETRILSHHIHRNGYHFKADIVEQACEELGYMPQGRKFVKSEDFKKSVRDSEIAKTLAKYNLPAEILVNQEKDESVKVRSAIRELFPKIPEEELEKIVKHAWEPGSGRVGRTDKPLYRRVQLAVIATIRHDHTDYDRLLRAFGWEVARASCEQDCLNKLIEWRGEDEASQNDDHLVEMVRETIVLDDDDDGNHSSAYPDNSDRNDGSTPKFRFVSQQVGDDSDIEPETVDDLNKKIRWRNANWPTRRDDKDATDRAREMIQAAYKLRASMPPAERATSVYVPPNQRGELADEIEVNGQRYRRLDAIRPVVQTPGPLTRHWMPQLCSHPHYGTPPTRPENGGAKPGTEQILPTSRAPSQHSLYTHYPSDRPIVRDGEDHGSKRRSIDESWDSPHARRVLHLAPSTPYSAHAPHSQYASPRPNPVSHAPTYPQPLPAVKNDAFTQLPTTDRRQQPREVRDAAPYDPEHPLLEPNDYQRRPHPRNTDAVPVGGSRAPTFGGPWHSVAPSTPVHGAPAPVQQVQVIFRNPDGSYSMPGRPEMRTALPGRAAQVPAPVDGAVAPTQFWSSYPAPQPRHGRHVN